MHYDTTIPSAVAVITAAAVAVDVWKRSGSTSKLVLNGMNRLFLKDVERESRAEAGAFLAGYITGLPCFAFQPSAIEALRCVYCEHHPYRPTETVRCVCETRVLGCLNCCTIWQPHFFESLRSVRLRTQGPCVPRLLSWHENIELPHVEIGELVRCIVSSVKEIRPWGQTNHAS